MTNTPTRPPPYGYAGLIAGMDDREPIEPAPDPITVRPPAPPAEPPLCRACGLPIEASPFACACLAPQLERRQGADRRGPGHGRRRRHVQELDISQGLENAQALTERLRRKRRSPSDK